LQSLIVIDNADLTYETSCPGNFQCGVATGANGQGGKGSRAGGGGSIFGSGVLIALILSVINLALFCFFWGSGSLNAYLPSDYQPDQVLRHCRPSKAESFNSFEDAADDTQNGTEMTGKDPLPARSVPDRVGALEQADKLSKNHHTVAAAPHGEWSSEGKAGEEWI